MQRYIDDAHKYGRGFLGGGNVADYIPELGRADINDIGLAVTDLKGEVYLAGDAEKSFTIQSIGKVIALAMAIEDVGFDAVLTKVGTEPTGDPFNSIIRLETLNRKPLNPMINAGAIAVISCIKGDTLENKLARLLRKAGDFLGNSNVIYDESVYKSEKDSGDKNRALAYMLKTNNIIYGDVEQILDLYFMNSSVLANCKEISHLGAVLANNGISPSTGQQVVSQFVVKVLCSLMTTCGMYDASGEYALRVGLPSKSGVGGGILAVSPGKMGICAYSPGLDQRGNSYCGIKMMEFLSTQLDLSIF